MIIIKAIKIKTLLMVLVTKIGNKREFSAQNLGKTIASESLLLAPLVLLANLLLLARGEVVLDVEGLPDLLGRLAWACESIRSLTVRSTTIF